MSQSMLTRSAITRAADTILVFQIYRCFGVIPSDDGEVRSMTLAESWTQKYTRLRNAEGAQAPDPTSMEELALAVFLTGRDEEGYGSYEQAYKLYLDEKHFARAVR